MTGKQWFLPFYSVGGLASQRFCTAATRCDCVLRSAALSLRVCARLPWPLTWLVDTAALNIDANHC